MRIEEVVLGLGGIWGLFRVSLGFNLGSNGRLEAQGGDVGFVEIWGLYGVQFGIKWAA